MKRMKQKLDIPIPEISQQLSRKCDNQAGTV